MHLLAIDPGLTTGMARSSDGDTWANRRWYTSSWTDPVEVVSFIVGEVEACGREKLTVVIEAFPGGGPRTKEAVHTLKVLGAAEYIARYHRCHVIIQQPQRRLAFIGQAADYLGPGVAAHEVDALAHAFAYMYLDKQE